MKKLAAHSMTTPFPDIGLARGVFSAYDSRRTA
jgi:hypothetical protein